MSSLCILGCPPKTRAKYSHRFPNPKKYPIQHEAWLKVIPEHKKENFEYSKCRICDNHFLKKVKCYKGFLTRNAIPTLCLPGQPSTHNNCNCDWKFAGADSPFTTNNVEVIINTVEGEHDYTTKIIRQKKCKSPLEKRHDYHSKPQEGKAIKYVQGSGNATSTCIKLLDRYEDIEKVAANGLTSTEIEAATNVTDTLENTLNNLSDKPQPVFSDADVVKVKTGQTKPQNHTEQNKKTKKKKRKISNYESENATPTCIKLLDYDDNDDIGKIVANRLTPTEIEDAKNVIYTLEKTLNHVSNKPHPVLSDNDVVKVETEQTKPQNQIEQNRKKKKTEKSNCKVYMYFIGKTFEQNNSKTNTVSNSNTQSNVTSPVQSLVSDATMTENISGVSNINYSVLKSGRNILVFDCIKNANISKLPQENIKTSMMPTISTLDTNSDELCIENDFPIKRFKIYKISKGCRKVVPQPVLSNADIKVLKSENISIAKTNSDSPCIYKDLQSNVTSNVIVTENTSSAKAIQKTKTLHKIQNNGRCKQSLIFNEYSFIKTEINKVIANSLLKSGCNGLNTNTIRNENISKLLQENTETSTMPKIGMTDSNSDELCKTENGIPKGCWKAVPQLVLSNADIADLETENTSIAKANTNTLIPVRIYNEENSTSGSCPGSPKRAKLDISELDEYKIVGSTTILTGLFVPDEIQPSEDPLEIHSPDIGVNDSLGLNENSVGSVEDSMGTVEDSMGSVEDSMRTVEGSMGTVEDSMGTVKDNMGTVEDNNMSCDEDNTIIDTDSSHPVDSLEFNNKDSVTRYVDEAEYELDASINEKDKLEIAYALKFIFKQGITAQQAFEEIVSTYGPGKISLKEAECWYREFELGNSVIRIISSGGPIYK